MRRLAALAAVLALSLAGCGGDGDDGDSSHAGHAGGGAADCPASGTLTVTAKDIAFDKECLAAPADQAFTVTLENKDTLPHNVAILRTHESTDTLFSGNLVSGPDKSTTYNVPALPAGTYHFHCNVHPDQMKGTFLVK